MAQVTVADEAGACFGVERALKLVDEIAGHEGSLLTLGPLIHNPRVVNDLEERGVAVVERPEDAPEGATLVMRTHGVSPALEERARAAGLTVVDATCPFVKRVHKAVERLERAGYQVVVAGEAGHPEVEGTLGHASGALVAGSASEAEALHLADKVGVVVQTTLERATLAEVAGAIAARVPQTLVHNTICDATARRQQAASELAARSDVMIVLGGKNSANTRHLADVCSDVCPHTHHVEGVGELDPAWFSGATAIGVTAGASTPASHITELVEALKRIAP